MSKYGVFSGPYFPVFGLGTEIYGVNLRVQSEYRKKRTKKYSVFGHFSRSVYVIPIHITIWIDTFNDFVFFQTLSKLLWDLTHYVN